VFVSWIAVPVEARMCAKKSGEEIPAASSGRLRVVPGGMGAAVEPRRVGVLVPADAEAVAVRRCRALPGVQALVDQRPIALDKELHRHTLRTGLGRSS
jgi:hypothetical protein